MNNNRQFDEHIREQFSNYTPEVHPRVWKKIVADKNKKRPPGFWVSMFSNRYKLLVLGLIIALSSGGAWMYYNQYVHKPASKTSGKEKLARPAQNNHNQQSQTTGPAENTATTNQLPGREIPTTVPEDNDIANQVPSIHSAGRIKAAITSPATAEETNGPAKAVKYKKNYTGLGNVLMNTTAPALEEDDFEGQGSLLGRLSFNGDKYEAKRRAGKPGTPSFNPVVYLPDCPITKDAAGNKKYFEFYAGPDYGIRSLHDTANSAYVQKRRESASFRSGFSAGARYTKVFNNSMSVRGGVNFSQINEKFTFNQGNIVQVTYIINANGDTIGSYTTTGSRHKTTINRYRSIDIPIVVGYEVGNGKLHANINAGAVVNIYSWQNGDVLDVSGNPVNITTGKSSSPYQFKTNAGVGFIGAVSVYYKLNGRFHLMAEPYFRYNFSPMNKESITLKQKYQTAGLRLGIRLDLK